MEQKQTFDRKHFFIDRKLQGRYMISFLIPMTVMLLFMLITLYFAANSMVSTTTSIIKKDIRNIKNNEFVDIENPGTESYENVQKKIEIYLRDFTEKKSFRKAVFSSILLVFGIGLFIIIIQIVLMTIFFSHKLAGPVYRFEIMCHRILDDDYTDRVHLRKGDEMQNLAKLLNEVTDRTSKTFLKLKNSDSVEENLKILNKIKF